MYRLLFATLLVRVPAETAHRISMALLRLITALPGAVALLRRYTRPDPVLRTRALGREFPSPVGLAAGFDKDARAYRALGAFGFGFVEVGTITAVAQPGNPRPRVFRLPADRALINRMGFNNHGAAAAARSLARRRADDPVLGVNIGRTKAVAEADAVADYVTSARTLITHADYLVVNVSSPNTPGLRDLQAVEHLRPLLTAVREVCADRVPLLVKIAPDLADGDIDAVADLAVELGLAGIIATNTTISRTGLNTPAEVVAAAGAGGLSGAPVRARSVEVLRRLAARVGDQLTLVSVGGVETVDDVVERLDAGADLVQVYTGLIYGGPFWIRGLQRELARRMR